VAHEARCGPLLLARRFGDLARLVGADLGFRLGGRGGHAAINVIRPGPGVPGLTAAWPQGDSPRPHPEPRNAPAVLPRPRPRPDPRRHAVPLGPRPPGAAP